MDVNSLDINTLATATVGLVGVAFGATASLVGTYWMERRRENRDCRALATSIRAELKAVLHVEREHQYREMYQDVLERIRRGENTPMPNISYQTDTARSVAYTNLSRIGILPEPVPAELVRLLYIFEVVVADRQCMDAGKWNTQEGPRRAEMLERHLTTYDALISSAEQVINHIDLSL